IAARPCPASAASSVPASCIASTRTPPASWWWRRTTARTSHWRRSSPTTGAPPRPLDKPLGRHPQARERMTVRQDGRVAVTHYEVLERYPGTDATPVASLLLCRLMTGRTHQIRVHLASIGHPLLGDHVYGAG